MVFAAPNQMILNTGIVIQPEVCMPHDITREENTVDHFAHNIAEHHFLYFKRMCAKSFS